MPHPRPTAPADALSMQLRTATSAIHKEAEQRPFMRAFFAGELPRAAYIEWLGRQWHLYSTLEDGLRNIPSGTPEAAVVPPVVYRSDRIADDLNHLTEGAWRAGGSMSPATVRYAERIASAASYPPALLVHAWLRYMGNIGGRDVLRRITASSIGVDPDSTSAGLAFTDFSAVGEVRPFFAAFHAALDALPLDGGDTARLVAEADAGFRLNIDLTDELAADCSIP